jgi:formylglycine-generating enzyme required for sulfatase activity
MTCFGAVQFVMGTDRPVFKADGEGPARPRSLSPFCLDQTAVSNRQFYEFVQETKHKTEVDFSSHSLNFSFFFF